MDIDQVLTYLIDNPWEGSCYLMTFIILIGLLNGIGYRYTIARLNESPLEMTFLKETNELTEFVLREYNRMFENCILNNATDDESMEKLAEIYNEGFLEILRTRPKDKDELIKK